MRSKNIEDAYALSPLQQGMLFHTLYAPTSGMYIEQLSCTLRGELDPAAFRQAWQHVVERHAILRSAFAWKNLEQPVQIVGRRVGLPLEQGDWRGLPPEEQAARLDAFLQADRERGFDLSVAPLLRLALFQVAEDAYYFVWTHHHLLLDGWSLPLVLDEVFQSYGAFAAGRPVALPPPRPYREYIAWLQRQDPTAAETFWREYLQGFRAPTPLGIDRPPAPSAPARFAVQTRHLSPAASASLDELVRAHSLTLNTLMQGAWALLLGCYSGAQDVLFGATVAGRPPDLPGAQAMVGLFINSVPVRLCLPPNARLLEWLAQLQAQQVELRQYEYSALVQVHGWSEVPRNLALFESLLVFENYPVGDEVAAQTSRPRLAVANLRAAAQTNYPLTIVVAPSQELLLEISYDTRRFAATAITRLLGHLETLLAAMVTKPHARLAEFVPLSVAEREQLLVEWNDTLRGVRGQGSGVSRIEPASNLLASDSWLLASDSQSIQQLFAAQSARTPDAIALAYSAEQLSYAALLQRASQLASYLQQRGVGPEALVALCLQRSLELPLALLGVLLAGAAYVPLDPAYPAERIAFMLEDCQASMLLTVGGEAGGWRLEAGSQSPVSSLQSPVSRAVVDLRADWPAIAQARAQALPGAASPDQLAYVIYTSGSTGTPKGAMVTQRGLVNFAVALAEQVDLRPGKRMLQFASFSFDASALQVFPTLIGGATLVLHRDPTRLSNQELLAFCTREQVTVLDLPASFWRQWVEDLAARDGCLPGAVEVCMTGGEKVTRDHLRSWARLARPSVRFFSSYGPTEATITTTLFSITRAQVDRLAAPDVPLGARLPNTQMFLLDRDMRPVPVGVQGEVYIGGVQLARGYLNRPDLTAARFIPNPFAMPEDERRKTKDELAPSSFVLRPSSFVRLYRTGDLARYLENGDIEFLGREDQQVKLRGFRVEPGEIEAALRAHPAVREAVVLARADGSPTSGSVDTRLVAYVVPTTDHRPPTTDQRLEDKERGRGGEGEDSTLLVSPSPPLISQAPSFISSLRDYLKQTLPEYMVPAAFVVLDALPLTPNGKLDQQALPAPDWTAAGSRQALVVPRDALELQLARIWEGVLKVRPIGVTDNFFELGGHSLLAVGLIAQIQKQLKQDLPLSALFQGPTVEQMAGLLRQRNVVPPYSPLVRIQPGDSKPPLFLVHPAGGAVLCYFKLAQHLGSDQPVYGLQALGLEEGQEPLGSIDMMAAQYIDALRSVQPQGPYRLGGWSVGGLVAFEMARQLYRQGHEVALLALLDTGAPLSSGDAPALDDARLLVDVVGQERLPLALDEFRQLELDAQLEIVLAALQQANLLPSDASLPQARRLLNVFKANVAAVANYAPQPYAGRIVLFKTESPLASEQPAEPTADVPSDEPSMGWSRLTAQPVEIVTVPGTHQTLIFEPHVQVLAEQLRACLEPIPFN